ncbi:flagellin [Marinobacter sp. HL-58]|uniref:flagellin N-terminal helical domain-containing protein n=1 Tax=Marinobacter sp. HL-58 TaxID=1479237 RepID=UPI0004855A5F|nr:flagellin [Marinobacter sp. HL-58]KPQ02386.1 MAG: flagellin FliC [Marinobacter sp. HL-58]
MALGINTNVASLSAQNQLNKSQQQNDSALERLSSGLRINSAKDDAAGLAISTRFSAQISGQNVAQRNANDGISYAQTAEGALGEITNALSRIRDLAVQSANDTNSASDREALNQETEALISEVNRIADSTQFNGQNILDGSLEDLQFQVGANAGQTIGVSGVDTRGSQLGSETFSMETGATQADIVAMAGDDLTINGVAIDDTDVTDMDSMVKAINAESGTTGVEAVKSNETVVTTAVGADLGADRTLTLNDVEIDITSGADDQAIADRINEFSTQTGVEARINDADELELTDSTGGTISIKVSDATELTGLDTSEEKYDAGIELRTDVDGTINVSSTDTDLVEAVLGTGNSGGLATDSNTLTNVDISDRDGASKAIGTIDQALDQVNSLRAELGAVQSRFESTISNLASSTENLSAANSRILDADFAAETANLSKSQVLQQAGISVLAQANARPQQVLSLLQ